MYVLLVDGFRNWLNSDVNIMVLPNVSINVDKKLLNSMSVNCSPNILNLTAAQQAEQAVMAQINVKKKSFKLT